MGKAREKIFGSFQRCKGIAAKKGLAGASDFRPSHSCRTMRLVNDPVEKQEQSKPVSLSI
jgi:hypothetical protein